MRTLIASLMVITLLATGFIASSLGFTIIETILIVLAAAALLVAFAAYRFAQKIKINLLYKFENLSTLVSTNAQSSQAMAQKIKRLSDRHHLQEIKEIEGDIDILSKMMRQVAETTVNIEDRLDALDSAITQLQELNKEESSNLKQKKKEKSFQGAEISYPKNLIANAAHKGMVYPLMQPIITLPNQKVIGYEVLASLKTQNDDIINAKDFIDAPDMDDVLINIDYKVINQSIQVMRRIVAKNRNVNLFINMSRATLNTPSMVNDISDLALANRAFKDTLFLEISQDVYTSLNKEQRQGLENLVKVGLHICLDNVNQLRLDFKQLYADGVRFLKVESNLFLRYSHKIADIHASDLNDLVNRFGIELIIDKVEQESEVKKLIDYDVSLIQGNYIAEPSPVRTDLLDDEEDNDFDAKEAAQ